MPAIESVVGTHDSSRLAYGINRHEYRAMGRLNPSALAAGLMGVREVDPAAVKAAFEQTQPPRATATQDRMDRGTLAHLAILQPELLASHVAVWTGDRRQGAAWDGFCEEHAGKLIVRSEDYQRTMATVNQLRSRPLATSLLVDVEPEVAVFACEVRAGLVIATKGQVDAVDVVGRRIVDIKTTEAGIDERSCERTCRDFRYREKMALYRRWVAMATGTSPEDWTCWNLFFGLGDHCGIRAVKFTSGAMDFGAFRMDAALDAVAECLKSRRWPLYEVSAVMDVAAWECPEEGEVALEWD